MLCLVFVIPLFIMTCAYAKIGKELWIVTSKRHKMMAQNASANGTHSDSSSNQKGDDDKTRKQVIKMLVAIIVIFAICHGPKLIDNVLVSFGYVHQLNYGHLKYMRQAFALMSYFNSCINPIVYAFMSKTFRESFRYALCVCSKNSDMYRSMNRGMYSPAASNVHSTGMTPTRPSPYPSPMMPKKAINSNCLLITGAGGGGGSQSNGNNSRVQTSQFLHPEGQFV